MIKFLSILLAEALMGPGGQSAADTATIEVIHNRERTGWSGVQAKESPLNPLGMDSSLSRGAFL